MLQTKLKRVILKKIILMIFWLISSSAFATDYFVNNPKDGHDPGSLRRILRHACDHPGKDRISFHTPQGQAMEIALLTPLVIPRDCQGPIELDGNVLTQYKTTLVVPERNHFHLTVDCDPSEEDCLYRIHERPIGAIHGDSCILNIYSDGNVVKNIRFLGNYLGAGICLFGRVNRIEQNEISENRYGVVITNALAFIYEQGMDGLKSELIQNDIIDNHQHALWIQATEATIRENKLSHTLFNSGVILTGNGHQVFGNIISENHGHGLHLQGHDMEIFGNTIRANEDQGIHVTDSQGVLMENVITQNHHGGVQIVGEDTEVLITHNQIFGNGGMEVDLENDGITFNDWLDQDTGPNKLLNFVDHMQFFPMGASLFWGWGVGHGDRVEIYSVPSIDWMVQGYGGGEDHVVDQDMDYACHGCMGTFEIALRELSGVDRVSLLSMKEEYTSEFSPNYGVGPDADFDGIIDSLEFGRSHGSLLHLVDSDGDGISDPLEDRNRNGIWDSVGAQFIAPETNASDPDTDGDGLSDGAETHGDGVYDVGIDTNPFNPDTDGDTIPDGREDANNNGVWDSYARETHPLSTDSDGDHHPDNTDTCPSVANPGQEVWYCL